MQFKYREAVRPDLLALNLTTTPPHRAVPAAALQTGGRRN
jgi:hypothetical protein